MTITIWGRPNSICTQRALWTCVEVGVDFDLVLASATMGPAGHVSTGAEPFGIVDTPVYRAMNPNGTVPTIDDRGYVLWESNAIVTYLALEYGPPSLSGSGAAGLAQQLKWMAWTNDRLEPALHTLVMECVRLSASERSPAAIQAANEDAIAGLEQLEVVLGQQPYMGGAQFGIADVPTACAAYRWILFELDGPPLPRLRAWLEPIMARDGFRTHVLPKVFHL